MSKIQKETFAYGEQYTDVNCIANFLRIFLIWAFLTSFFSIFLCYSFLGIISEYLNIWFIIY
ncbi:hypothetical protein, partial [Acinetobacter stercoris]|uniref:hypothetical protein n=1 Tax=Acinetobacter stercoris TaxID=2126983 RepID=UPI001BC87870